MTTAIQLLVLTIFIDQLLQLLKFIIALKQAMEDIKNEKQIAPYKVFINPDGKLFYEDQYQIALVDGIVASEIAKVKVEVKFGSKYITQK